VLHSALSNILQNALLHTKENSTIGVMLTACEKEELQYQITITDDGPGVPIDQLKEIFRPFYRIADARDRESGGHGLGLAITKRAIELHKGTIEATNVQGRGLMITLCLR
jgi:two-component system sensor histidine kinase CpxA